VELEELGFIVGEAEEVLGRTDLPAFRLQAASLFAAEGAAWRRPVSRRGAGPGILSARGRIG
jgi:hypothetical protein